jgi:hypothetical protein
MFTLASCGTKAASPPKAEDVADIVLGHYRVVMDDNGDSATHEARRVTLKLKDKSFPQKYEGDLWMANMQTDPPTEYTHDLYVTFTGKTVDYYYVAGEWQEEHSVALDEGDSIYNPAAGIPGGLSVISVFSGDYEAKFIHVKITNNIGKYLAEAVGQEKTISKNIYIPIQMYEYFHGQIESSFGVGTMEIAGSMLNTVLVSSTLQGMFYGLETDNFPESLYPINDKNAEDRFYTDIAASMLFAMIASETASMHSEILSLSERDRDQRYRRLNASIHKGNKELFAAVFPDLAKNKDITYKAFVAKVNADNW